MNEIERIIKKGVIPDSFLQEEVRNGFLVTKERKKLWCVMLDLLLELDKVCKKHNLTYFLWSGSLLGAVRHNGIIPWDDDIDVIMPRHDYEKFLELGNEFKAPYFSQTPYTDPECYYSFAKIRNSNTTGIVEMFKYQKFNHGIWISIMPIDNWDIEGGEERYEKIRSLLIDCSTYMRATNPNLSKENIERVRSFKERKLNPLDLYEEILRITGQFKDIPTGYVAHDSCTIAPYSNAVFHAEDFEKPTMWRVEGFEFPIPNGFDRILRTMYGDYLKFPPVEERGKWHEGTYFNTEISYKDYLKNNITT